MWGFRRYERTSVFQAVSVHRDLPGPVASLPTLIAVEELNVSLLPSINRAVISEAVFRQCLGSKDFERPSTILLDINLPDATGT